MYYLRNILCLSLDILYGQLTRTLALSMATTTQPLLHFLLYPAVHLDFICNKNPKIILRKKFLPSSFYEIEQHGINIFLDQNVRIIHDRFGIPA